MSSYGAWRESEFMGDVSRDINWSHFSLLFSLSPLTPERGMGETRGIPPRRRRRRSPKLFPIRKRGGGIQKRALGRKSS